MTQRIEVGIKGSSPLLMHQYPMVPIDGIEKMKPAEQAVHSAYRMPDGTLYIPGLNIQRALVAGAAFSKGKGRSTLQKVVAACVLVTPEYVSLGTKDYTIDSRRVVIAATKGSVIRHRPRLDAWECSFTLDYDPTLIKEQEMRRVVDDTGIRVGLLDFRPEKKGPFGRYMVTSWTVS